MNRLAFILEHESKHCHQTPSLEFLSFALTIFTSAFLLFQVQPLLSKQILPWFGGSPAVWTTAMLFFQTLLCLGYLCACIGQGAVSPDTGPDPCDFVGRGRLVGFQGFARH